jgi:acyl carrier protein
MTQEEIKNYLSEQICDTMYMEQEDLDGDTLFSDFGLESTSLIKIISKVNQRFSCNIEVKELLTFQSLNSATGFIFNRLNKN